MIHIVHQHSNFSSKFSYFFSQSKQEKKTLFLPTFFLPLHFFPLIFFPTKFHKDQTEPKGQCSPSTFSVGQALFAFHERI